jgi:hypothetical protein
VRVPPPCGFGISTARTGGGKYDPDDIRFQILYRLFFRSFSKSASDTLSTPGAPLFARTFSYASQTARFEISNDLSGAFNSPTQLLPSISRLIEQASHERPDPFAPPPLQGLHHYYESVRQRPTASVLNPSRLRAAWDTPSRPPNGRPYPGAPSPVPHESRRSGSRRLYAGHRLASKRAPARLIPGLH